MTVRGDPGHQGKLTSLPSRPSSTLADAARALAQHRIGAVVATGPGDRIVGILSERDIVRVIGEQGPEGLEGPVSEAMSTNVKLCNENHTHQRGHEHDDPRTLPPPARSSGTAA